MFACCSLCLLNSWHVCSLVVCLLCVFICMCGHACFAVYLLCLWFAVVCSLLFFAVVVACLFVCCVTC